MTEAQVNVLGKLMQFRFWHDLFVQKLWQQKPKIRISADIHIWNILKFSYLSILDGNCSSQKRFPNTHKTSEPRFGSKLLGIYPG